MTGSIPQAPSASHTDCHQGKRGEHTPMRPLAGLVSEYRAHPEIGGIHIGVFLLVTVPLIITGSWLRCACMGVAAICVTVGSSWLTIGCRRHGWVAVLIAIVIALVTTMGLPRLGI